MFKFAVFEATASALKQAVRGGISFIRNGSQIKNSLMRVFGSQFLVYAISFIQIKFLTSMFAPADYGVLAFAQAVIAFAVVFTSYAVNNTGVAAYKAARDTPEKARVVCENLIAQSLLALIAVAAFLVAVLSSDLDAHRGVYVIASVAFFSNVFWPAWIYVAEEDFKAVARWTVSVRVASLLTLVVLMQVNAGLPVAAACIFLTSFFPVPFAVRALKRAGLLTARAVREAGPLNVLGRDFGIASMSWLVFAYSFVPLLMGKVLMPLGAFGIYAFADRFRALAVGLIGVGGMVLYSRFCTHLHDPNTLRTYTRRALALLFAMSSGIAIALIIVSDEVVSIVGGAAYIDAKIPLRILALTLPFNALNYFVSYFVVPNYALSGNNMRCLAIVVVIGAAAISTTGDISATQLAASLLVLEAVRFAVSLLMLKMQEVRLLYLKPPACPI